MRGSDGDDRVDRHTDRERAFARLVDARLDAEYRLATVILDDRFEAEDAVHDAVVIAWSRYGSLHDPSRFDAWFGRILVNACRDRLRTRRRRPVVDIGAAVAAGRGDIPTTPDGARRAEEQDGLDRSLAGLDAEHRIVVVLRFWMDLPVDAIAERLAIPAGTVKSRLNTAMRRLRTELDAMGWTDR